MDTQKDHWENVYSVKAPTEVSWYREHLETSLAWIQRVCPDHSSAVIDVGGGESTLVEDVLSLGYTDLSVLDISPTSLKIASQRLGVAAEKVHWLVGNICELELARSRYDLWHDRAVFHFLTSVEQRISYRAKAAASVKKNGHLIVSTFGPDGPLRCSGRDVVRYDADTLQTEIGLGFRLVESRIEDHITPSGGRQQFLYCLFVHA